MSAGWSWPIPRATSSASCGHASKGFHHRIERHPERKGPPHFTCDGPVLKPWGSSDLRDRPNVGGLRALLALGNVELDLLVLLQVPVPRASDRAEVHEHVGAAVVLGDEAEALLAV